MNRFFNTAGPVKKYLHYHIDPLDRIDLDDIMSLIQQEKYFVLHAPRQTGKTSYLNALMDHLNKGDTYKCLYVNVEVAQAARENVQAGMQTILAALAAGAKYKLNDPFIDQHRNEVLKHDGPFFALQNTLSQWCRNNDKPVVLLIDEVDSLVGDTLISLLRQLRAGYNHRPLLFPQSIILCGIRDVRDYRIHSDKEKTIITGGSAFNIKAKSLSMDHFSPEEIKKLLLQHTEDTGQTFTEAVFPLVWELTEGQPWLVNALAYETCFDIKEGRDRSKIIDVHQILQAKENLILRRDTHLDQLIDKLHEERVRRVIEPILAGLDKTEDLHDDDIEYVKDLGLIKKRPQLAIANGIYREVIPRALTYATQLRITHHTDWYVAEDGSLDMDKLLTAFQGYFRKNIESWLGGFDYKEAGPQLLVQAFLQRIVNGGGSVGREYGLGKMRTDLLVTWPYKKETQQAVIELKIRYGALESTIDKGVQQTGKYMDKCGTKEGYLLIFDRRENISWEKKIFKKEKTSGPFTIKIYGM
ncbi:MAG: ATP-binding protein [bacterium]|nr:ATP-binding protein [bacterium]